MNAAPLFKGVFQNIPVQSALKRHVNPAACKELCMKYAYVFIQGYHKEALPFSKVLLPHMDLEEGLIASNSHISPAVFLILPCFVKRTTYVIKVHVITCAHSNYIITKRCYRSLPTTTYTI